MISGAFTAAIGRDVKVPDHQVLSIQPPRIVFFLPDGRKHPSEEALARVYQTVADALDKAAGEFDLEIKRSGEIPNG